MNTRNISQHELWKYIEEKATEIIEKKFRPADEIILDDMEIQGLLKISRRTSLEWRTRGFLRYHKIGEGKIYYFLNEVIDDIKT